MMYDKQKFFDELVPESSKGKEVTLTESIREGDTQLAEQKFRRAVEILLRPGKWNDVAGGARFSISHNPDQESIVKENDFIRINIPGPGPANGEGYDWVMVEKIIDQTNDEQFPAVGLLLKASPDPDTDDKAPAHFFGEGASSTIIIFRESDTITAKYFGRNEAPNVHTDSVITNIRNTVVAAGAMFGLSELQWSSLLKGLIKK
ncbi:MAG: hypothetical protein EOO02_06310 [Chitinophagaceae bacterium]|nr:MAG: hypothetical protein EOO02_06310 [Chitinophagaceae bacterium]